MRRPHAQAHRRKTYDRPGKHNWTWLTRVMGRYATQMVGHWPHHEAGRPKTWFRIRRVALRDSRSNQAYYQQLAQLAKDVQDLRHAVHTEMYTLKPQDEPWDAWRWVLLSNLSDAYLEVLDTLDYGPPLNCGARWKRYVKE